MIRFEDVTKRYGDVTAVDNMSVSVKAGELFGFLGANGAGKTTTLRMMTGLLRPSEGSIVVGGYDMSREPDKAKAVCGYVPDQPYLYERLTGQEMLELVADLRGVEEPRKSAIIAKYLDYFELTERRNYLIEGYSHGMRQKLALCSALLHEPSVLYLDEPTNGLDPLGVKRLKDLLVAHCAAGGTVLLSTHVLEIAESLCARVAIMRRGRLVAQGSVGGLKNEIREKSLEGVFLELTSESAV